jgi:hypothetical protein
MDDFLKKETNDIENLSLGDKKIEFKLIKEKRSNVTYVLNLEHYITDPGKLETTIKKLKKSLGTACVKRDAKETGAGTGTGTGTGTIWYGFNGDLKIRIIQHLIDVEEIPKTAFK